MSQRIGVFTPVVGTLILANVAVYLLLPQDWIWSVYQRFALWPLAGSGVGAWPNWAGSFELWQLLTYGFLHGGFLHLFFNLFALWMFGSVLEQVWGSARFLFFFLVCVVGAGLVQLFVATQAVSAGSLYPTVGASGGVFGVLLAFAMLFPNQKLRLLIPPVAIKAKYLVILYGAFTLYAGVTGSIGGVAHFAHLGGMVFGFILVQYWHGVFRWRRR
jgi:membrane associated rhomboid family serine protease